MTAPETIEAAENQSEPNQSDPDKSQTQQLKVAENQSEAGKSQVSGKSPHSHKSDNKSVVSKLSSVTPSTRTRAVNNYISNILEQRLIAEIPNLTKVDHILAR